MKAGLRGRGLPEPDGPALYRLLRELEADGLLRSDWYPSDEGPARRVYRVTGKGTRQLRRDAEAMAAIHADLTVFMAEWQLLSGRITRRRTSR